MPIFQKKSGAVDNNTPPLKVDDASGVKSNTQGGGAARVLTKALAEVVNNRLKPAAESGPAQPPSLKTPAVPASRHSFLRTRSEDAGDSSTAVESSSSSRRTTRGGDTRASGPRSTSASAQIEAKASFADSPLKRSTSRPPAVTVLPPPSPTSTSSTSALRNRRLKNGVNPPRPISRSSPFERPSSSHSPSRSCSPARAALIQPKVTLINAKASPPTRHGSASPMSRPPTVTGTRQTRAHTITSSSPSPSSKNPKSAEPLALEPRPLLGPYTKPKIASGLPQLKTRPRSAIFLSLPLIQTVHAPNTSAGGLKNIPPNASLTNIQEGPSSGPSSAIESPLRQFSTAGGDDDTDTERQGSGTPLPLPNNASRSNSRTSTLGLPSMTLPERAVSPLPTRMHRKLGSTAGTASAPTQLQASSNLLSVPTSGLNPKSSAVSVGSTFLPRPSTGSICGRGRGRGSGIAASRVSLVVGSSFSALGDGTGPASGSLAVDTSEDSDVRDLGAKRRRSETIMFARGFESGRGTRASSRMLPPRGRSSKIASPPPAFPSSTISQGQRSPQVSPATPSKAIRLGNKKASADHTFSIPKNRIISFNFADTALQDMLEEDTIPDNSFSFITPTAWSQSSATGDAEDEDDGEEADRGSKNDSADARRLSLPKLLLPPNLSSAPMSSLSSSKKGRTTAANTPSKIATRKRRSRQGSRPPLHSPRQSPSKAERPSLLPFDAVLERSREYNLVGSQENIEALLSSETPFGSPGGMSNCMSLSSVIMSEPEEGDGSLILNESESGFTLGMSAIPSPSAASSRGVDDILGGLNAYAGPLLGKASGAERSGNSNIVSKYMFSPSPSKGRLDLPPLRPDATGSTSASNVQSPVSPSSHIFHSLPTSASFSRESHFQVQRIAKLEREAAAFQLARLAYESELTQLRISLSERDIEVEGHQMHIQSLESDLSTAYSVTRDCMTSREQKITALKAQLAGTCMEGAKREWEVVRDEAEAESAAVSSERALLGLKYDNLQHLILE